MAYLQQYFWILKAASGEDDYKWASGGHDITPKLYRTEGYARSAAKSSNDEWVPVKVRIEVIDDPTRKKRICKEKNSTGNCPLHNIYCQYPKCEEE